MKSFKAVADILGASALVVASMISSLCIDDPLNEAYHKQL